MRIVIRRIDLAPPLVDGAENRLDARRGLRHERRSARRRNGQHGDVAAPLPDHLGVEFGIGLADALDHGVVLLLGSVVDGESAALAGHLDRRAVSLDGQGLLHLDSESDGLIGTVAQSQGGEHVALGRDAQACATPLEGHRPDLFPQIQLDAAHVLVLGVGGDLLDDQLDLLQLQVDDVVHHAHCLGYVLLELGEVELGLLGKRIVDIGQQIERQQTARIVGTQGNFAARIGRNRDETLVGIAIGDALADDRIPEQHARFGRLPSIVDDLLPQLPGVDLLLVLGLVGTDGELLPVLLAGDGGTHELVVDLDRDVGAGNFAGVDLRVDEPLGIGMLDRQ